MAKVVCLGSSHSLKNYDTSMACHVSSAKSFLLAPKEFKQGHLEITFFKPSSTKS